MLLYEAAFLAPVQGLLALCCSTHARLQCLSSHAGHLYLEGALHPTQGYTFDRPGAGALSSSSSVEALSGARSMAARSMARETSFLVSDMIRVGILHCMWNRGEFETAPQLAGVEEGAAAAVEPAGLPTRSAA